MKKGDPTQDNMTKGVFGRPNTTFFNGKKPEKDIFMYPFINSSDSIHV